MLVFEQVTYKNFLSTGNQPTTIYLNKSPTTLIYGGNGQGKSTFLDALTFALFGKAYRNINKPALINSVNGSDCYVEIIFTIGKARYKVERGMKPNIFNIYINDKLINQDSKAKDYQRYLEQTILKMTEKSFRQIVVLGSSSFVPFMQLPLAHRRDVIEDLLDISIFSAMNKIMKLKYDSIKDDLREIDYKLDLLGNQHEMLVQFIKTNQDRISQNVAQKKKIIDDAKSQIEEKAKELGIVKEDIEGQKTHLINEGKLLANLREYNASLIRLEQSQAKVQGSIEFFHDKNTCPTCKQGITEDHRKDVLAHYEKQISEYTSAIAKAKEIIAKIEAKLEYIAERKSVINTLEREQDSLKSAIAVHLEVIENVKREIDSNGVDDLANDKVRLQKLVKEIEGAKAHRLNKLLEKDYYDDISLLLKDSGIKTKIIRYYLPIINQTINKYLTQLGLNVNFMLDETFAESIKSRYKDEFTYFSFSEGEKERINLAIMFAWRHIAAMKNSTNTNLLVMDETFDSSLDNEATDELLNLINALTDGGKTNVFVISHKSGDVLYDKFRTAIQFKKVNGFTKIV